LQKYALNRQIEKSKEGGELNVAALYSQMLASRPRVALGRISDDPKNELRLPLFFNALI